MDHFHYLGSHYHAEDVPLEAIAQSVGTPFYCYSSATLTRHYRVLEESFSGLSAKICYAVKANSSLGVLATLARLAAGADVVSEGEIHLAKAAGIHPRDIVFSGVGKMRGEMAYALEQEIFQFNVESEAELHLLNEVACAKGRRAPVAIRVNPDVASNTHAKISTGHKESKFGVPMDEARALYHQARGMHGIEVQGVSVHIGSQITSLEPFAEAFRLVAEFTRSLRGEGIPINTLDIGGGLGIPYTQEEIPLPGAYGEIVRAHIGPLGCRLILEPGRLLVGNAGVLVTRVLYVKRSAGRVFVIIDAGMNDLLRPALYGAQHEIVLVAAPLQDRPKEMVDIVGPVCETGDIFAEQRPMALPQPGELLAIRSAGAYGAAMASTYNARPLVPEVMVHGGQYAVTRPRQGIEQMLAAQALPDWLA